MIWLTAIFCAILIALFVIWLLHRFYAKATLDTALIRTGFGGRKVVIDGGCVSLPILHQIQRVSLGANAFTVAREGREALRTKDQMRADVRMEFEFSVSPTPDAVVKAAQNFGTRLARGGDVIEELLKGPAMDAMQNAASAYELETLHGDRAKFSNQVGEAVRLRAQTMGLDLVSTSLLTLDQSDLNQFSEDNVFNATGRRRMTEIVSKERKERVRIETETEIEIGESLLSRQQHQLDQSRTEREAQIAQQEYLRRLENDALALSAEQKHAAELKQEKANLAKEHEIKLARIKSDQDARKAEMDAILKLEQDKISNDVALTKKRAEISSAKALEETARADYLLASEAVQTQKERAIAEREREMTLLKRKAQDEAEFERVKAEANASNLRVKSETENAKAIAEAQQLKMEAEAKGRAAQIAAENGLSEAIIGMKIEEKRLERLPEIMTQMMKPVEKIESIKINHIGGLGGASQGGDGNGSAFSSAMDQILGMAVTLPAMKQMGDQIGVEFDANIAGRTADYANRIKAKDEKK